MCFNSVEKILDPPRSFIHLYLYIYTSCIVLTCGRSGLKSSLNTAWESEPSPSAVKFVQHSQHCGRGLDSRYWVPEKQLFAKQCEQNNIYSMFDALPLHSVRLTKYVPQLPPPTKAGPVEAGAWLLSLTGLWSSLARGIVERLYCLWAFSCEGLCQESLWDHFLRLSWQSQGSQEQSSC